MIYYTYPLEHVKAGTETGVGAKNSSGLLGHFIRLQAPNWEDCMEQRHKNEGPGIVAILIGIAAVAFCCFSPFILAALGAAGLAAFFRQYLAVLMVLAGAIVVVGVLSYRRFQKRDCS